MQQYVKWDGERIVKGPQSRPGDDTWVLFIPAQNRTSPRDRATCEFIAEINAVVQTCTPHEPNYREKRAGDYPKIADQLDALYRDLTNDTLTREGEWYQSIQTVKVAHPKPSETDGD